MLNLSDLFTKHHRRIAIISIAIFIAIVLINVFIYWYFPHYVDPRTPADTINTLQTSIQITSLFVSLLGSFLLIGTVITALDSISQTQESLKIARESQITDRFTKAIDQLGSDKLAIRLGGIYALERIAKDSPRDHWTMVEVLTAFVRANAPAPNPWEDDDHVVLTPETKPPSDIQAILTVLGRRPEERRREEPQPLNLMNTNLRGADLRDASLQRALLMGSSLDGAFLRSAHLSDANLAFAHLRAAQLIDADCSRADMACARLAYSNLSGATMIGTLLVGANLNGVTEFTQKQLDEAILSEDTILPKSAPNRANQ